MSGVGVAGVPARTLMYPLSAIPPFGIYHPSLPEWQAYAYESLIKAQQPVRKLVDGLPVPDGSGDRFEINRAFALTYVELRDTKFNEDLHKVNLAQVIERVGNLSARNEVIAVPIKPLKWCHSHVVAPFDQEACEYKRLLEHQRHIERILCEAGMGQPPVNRPHHTSLSSIRYDIEPLHTKLHNKPRNQIIGMLSKGLSSAGIDTVELGCVMVGESYDVPITPGGWMTERFVEIASYEDEKMGTK